MSKVTALYHIVFCTKARQMTIPLEYANDLYRSIWKESTDMDCYLLRVGGIQNHVHLLIDLNPKVALADLMRNVKAHSSGWMRADNRFPDFIGWAGEYFGCSISPEQKYAVIEYIKGQQEHHLGNPFDNELVGMYRCADLDYHDMDLR